MCHTRAPSAARRARAREWRGGLGVDCDRGRGRTAPSTLRLFVGRREACIENAPCAWPCATQFAVYPKNALPGVWRARVLNTAARSALGFTMIESQSVGLRLRGRYTCVRQTGQRRRVRIFYPPAPPRDRYRVRARGWRQARTRRRDTRPCDAVPKRRGFDAATPAHPPPRVMAGFFLILFFVPDIAMECRRRGRGLARTGALASSGGTGRGHRAVLRLEQDQCKRVVSSRTNAARRLLHTLVVARAVLKLPRS